MFGRWQHTHGRQAVGLQRHGQRRRHQAEAGGVLAVQSGPPSGQPVALPQGAALVSAKSAAHLRAARAQHGGHVHAAGQAQVGPAGRPSATPAAVPRRSTGPARATQRHQGSTGWPSSCAPVSAPVSAKRQSLGESHLEREHRQLDARVAVVVAQQQVAGGQRQRVHRARGAHAPAQGAEAAQVLHRGQRGGRQDLDHRNTRSTRNRMLSPGCKQGRRVLRGVEEAHGWCGRSCSSRSGPRRPTRRSARLRWTPSRPGC